MGEGIQKSGLGIVRLSTIGTLLSVVLLFLLLVLSFVSSTTFPGANMADLVLYQKHVPLPVQSLVSDAAFLVSALFFTYVGFIRTKEGRDTLLEEPLLNGARNSSIGDTAESDKSKGDATVNTLYSNAGIFSILTFSWMSPVIAAGNKKTLDLEDVPELDKADSVVGSYPVFRNRLESECGTLSRVTTLHLVKALIFSAWREILWIALFVLLYTMASYVGPYLIDTFVQYLYGRREFEYEGYALVSTFLVAKLVEWPQPEALVL
ncbi:hypothetical protein ACLB2K_041738 [Fragaria x ananassa]